MPRSGLAPFGSRATGTAGSESLDFHATRMLQGNFEPGFSVKHFLKDLRIILKEAKMLGLVLPGVELAQRLYDEARDQGYEEKGIQALLLALAEITHVEWKPQVA